MFSIKPDPEIYLSTTPHYYHGNITDGDLNSKLNTLEYLNCITNIINSCGVYPQGLKTEKLYQLFTQKKLLMIC